MMGRSIFYLTDVACVVLNARALERAPLYKEE